MDSWIRARDGHVLDDGARALLARDPSPHDSTERTVRA